MAIQGIPLNKTEIIEAIHLKRGIITKIAAHLDCHHQTIYDWMEKDIDVSEAIKKARSDNKKRLESLEEEIENEAVEAMRDLIGEREVAAVIFTMKSRRKWSQDTVNHNVTINRIDKPWPNEKKAENKP